MAKSFKSRLDDAYRALTPTGACLGCGNSLDVVMEIYFQCQDDPEDTVYVSHPADVKHCNICQRPTQTIIWEAESLMA